MTEFDVLIIGASASGLMCAIEAGKRGRRVLVLDHANKAGKKIRISGGGRCNFSNYDVSAENYLSQNPHFCKSALSRYQYYDFINLLAHYDIPWHEREHGQLFCDRSATDIVQMLLTECQQYQVVIQLNSHISQVHASEQEHYFSVQTQLDVYQSDSLVIATGGLSVAKMGATDFGLRLAKQFGLKCVATRPGLVPLIYNNKDSKRYKQLSGITLKAQISFNHHHFKENLLFTHKGISGPVVLQISSYWLSHRQEPLQINLLPDLDLISWLEQEQQKQPKLMLKNSLSKQFPKRLIECLCQTELINKPINQYSSAELQDISDIFQNWRFWPKETEGYRVAEVTIGGVDTDELSSKTMQVKTQKGLYFIGEVMDVAGQLGGYNFQWAWSSGFSAGQVV